MILNQDSLMDCAPIKNMVGEKRVAHGTSYGLTEAGYDIRIKQNVYFEPHLKTSIGMQVGVVQGYGEISLSKGRFCLASSIEEFDMPEHLVGKVHDKSTWARRGLSVFNTVIEPGWKGFLTLELVYHGEEKLFIPAGSGIAQILFFETQHHASYDGKYQNQENKPVPAKESV
ncbi:dCTP deaminase [Alcaligenes phage vB_Af_QDWS595]|uniref:Deoxycytidine triphosphate deaminase n=1 Tax=Alcaligenes phage vB_Af_QDWS595 TaxID=2877946 RepID=A0AAE9C0I2_9CAUD|nr:dCTP deaminase [Alcaligenes phage vB_Af_QDWS595]UCR75533.1 putative deoxycytidine triphosphate deaminase [Alcaligenes phage vB_Af_QDWS595]